MLKTGGLTCNHKVNPKGVSANRAYLSWKLFSERAGAFQSAYRIVAASDMEKLGAGAYDLWDSGKVFSDRCTFVLYEGAPLREGRQCFWRVEAWDETGERLPMSHAAVFEGGVGAWRGKWIGAVNAGGSAPVFKKSFKSKEKPVSARLYICGLGFYDARINGENASDAVLAPAFTAYDKTLLYDILDVTGLVEKGENEIDITLGNGWYNENEDDVWNFSTTAWKADPKLLMQLELRFADGTKKVVASDESFQTAAGPTVFNALRNGEYYDARITPEKWESAAIVRSPGGALRANEGLPIKIVKKHPPAGKIGDRVIDFGGNFAGFIYFSGSGNPGDEIVFKYGEHIADGGVCQKDMSRFIGKGEVQTDKYIFSGKGRESWSPRFVYHGFRYVEIICPKSVKISEIKLCEVHTELAESGEFSCSDEGINKLHEVIKRSSLNNIHGIITDCPHREKNGWTGDALISAEQMLLNFNIAPALIQWLRSFKDAQRPSGQLPGIIPSSGWGYNWGSGPAWDSALILIPWYIYIYTGDISAAEEMLPYMKKYLAFMDSMANGYIVDYGLMDWCHPEKYKDESKICPAAVTDTAYYYLNNVVVGKICRVLGLGDKKYREKSERIKNAFLKRFEKDETIINDSQTSLSCALHQGLSNSDALFERLLEKIGDKNGHVYFGIMGAKYVMGALFERGRADVALDMIAKKTYPGWGYMLENGATALWEMWDGGGSQNHHMFSDVGQWFYKGFAGIRPCERAPGFKHFKVIVPRGLALSSASAAVETMYGAARASWEKKGGKIALRVSVPPNTTAEVIVSETHKIPIGPGEHSFII